MISDLGALSSIRESKLSPFKLLVRFLIHFKFCNIIISIAVVHHLLIQLKSVNAKLVGNVYYHPSFRLNFVRKNRSVSNMAELKSEPKCQKAIGFFHVRVTTSKTKKKNNKKSIIFNSLTCRNLPRTK